MSGGGGFMSAMNDAIKYNRRLKSNSTKRYKDIRKQYIGSANQLLDDKKTSLTPAQIAEGRKRAIAYYTKRNRRIYTQIVIVSLVVCALVGMLMWYLLSLTYA